MTLKTTTQYLILNARTGEVDPRRWLSSQEAARAACLRSWSQENYADWHVWSELLVEQPTAETV